MTRDRPKYAARERTARRDLSRREMTIELGRRTLLGDRHERRTTSLVFEDALRELLPDTSFADAIAHYRGRYEERVFIQQAITYLENLPKLQLERRVLQKVEAILSRAWKKEIITRADESEMPILSYLDRWIRRGLQVTTIPPYGGFSAFQMKKSLRRMITQDGFRLSSRSPRAQQRLAKRVADAIYTEAQRS